MRKRSTLLTADARAVGLLLNGEPLPLNAKGLLQTLTAGLEDMRND